jgi:hypothetical protein
VVASSSSPITNNIQDPGAYKHASMNYFDSSTNNLTYFKWKSVNGNACNNKIH